MPQFEPHPPAAGPVVTGFAGTGYRCEERVFPDGLMLTPETAQPWGAVPLDELTADMVASLIAIEPRPEFLLLGTGAEMRRPPKAFRDELDRQGVGVEAMDSRAAARCWGMLRREGRWIVAALLPLTGKS